MGKRQPHTSASNITAGHVRAFQAVTTQMYGEVSLWSCTINGEAGVAIVLVQDAGEGKLGVMPLFVAITENMEIDFEGETRTASSGGGSKRPKDTREAFDVIKDHITAPAPV